MYIRFISGHPYVYKSVRIGAAVKSEYVSTYRELRGRRPCGAWEDMFNKKKYREAKLPPTWQIQALNKIDREFVKDCVKR